MTFGGADGSGDLVCAAIARHADTQKGARLVRIIIVLSVLLASCAPPAPPVEETQAPPAGQVVHATGAFSLTLPDGVRKVPVQGIDSAVDQFEGPNYTIMTDYGMFGCGAEEAGPGRTVGTATIDGRAASTVRYRGREGERPVQLTVRFNNLNDNAQQPLCLAAHAQCDDDAACDAAFGMINSIDFD